jgi:hypothetical protein
MVEIISNLHRTTLQRILIYTPKDRQKGSPENIRVIFFR